MKYYVLMLLVLIGFTSCEEFENSAKPSEVTFLPSIEVLGESSIDLDCSATGYTDDGASATEGGETISVTTTISGRYFGGTAVDGADFYDITYSAVNVDDIPGAASREVFWPECNGDFVSGIEGMYTASVFRIRETTGATVDYSDADHGPYWVKDLGGGVYGFTCVIGQFYEYGYGYGPAYAGTGFDVTANSIPGNDFTVGSTNGVGAFGGDIEVTDFSIDPIAKTISWSADWSFNYHFDVVLTQVPE